MTVVTPTKPSDQQAMPDKQSKANACRFIHLELWSRVENCGAEIDTPLALRLNLGQQP